jgi:hypothetical protein
VPHAQQQILDAMQGILAAGGTIAGSRVFLDRVDPLQPGELPAVLLSEEPEGEIVEPSTVEGLDQRELGVAVSCVLAHGTTAAADAREFGLAVEKLLAGSPRLGGLASLGSRITASRMTVNGDGDRLMAARQQSWRVTYLVMPTTPDLPI